jgi:ADP-heptose:LPS heptosyltransferase
MQTLIIRPGAIGDTLLTLPVLTYLRTQLGTTPLTFVGNSRVLPILQAFGMSEASMDYEDPRWSQLFLTPRQQHAPDFFAYLHTFTLAICWLRDSEGCVRQNLRAAGIKQICIVAGRPAPKQQMHITDYLAHSLRPILQYPPVTPLPWQAPTAYAWQPPTLTTDTIVQRRYIIIQPGSGGKDKCWPLAAFTEVIKQLWQQEIPVLLLTGPAEQELLHRLQPLLATAPTGLLRRMDNAPLLTIANAMRTARGYLGNDSGLTHLAALLGLPTTAIFGPSDPLRWHPIGPHVRILHATDINTITPAQVIHSILV